MRKPGTAYLALFLLIAPLCAARDLAVVVNKSNSSSSVTAAELEKLLKGTAQTWPDGKKVKIFITDPAAAENRTIVSRAYKLSPVDTKSFIDSHKAEIEVVPSDDIVLMMVEKNPGAIGIVNVYSITSQVKVLKIDQKLPMEQGYLLHGN